MVYGWFIIIKSTDKLMGYSYSYIFDFHFLMNLYYSCVYIIFRLFPCSYIFVGLSILVFVNIVTHFYKFYLITNILLTIFADFLNYNCSNGSSTKKTQNYLFSTHCGLWRSPKWVWGFFILKLSPSTPGATDDQPSNPSTPGGPDAQPSSP